MQNITFYARAAETLGEFTDYANAKTKPAPILTRGVAVYLRMRLFKEDGSLDPVPIDTFADVKAWQWVMDDDFDSTSNYILVAQHDQITVEAKTEEIEGESREITEFTIPIPEMNTEELDAVLQKKENVANLNGELVGLNGAGEAVYILQLKGFTVRNRISSAGNPTPITAEYYTAEQTRAIIAGTNAYELARKAEFNIGDRAYYPGEPGYLLVCVDEGTSAADLPELDKTVNLFLDGTVTWQVYDLSASGGGAANITVNDVSPDAEGNILLGAEDISFNFKDSMGDDIPTSPAISNLNLQDFFKTMQYAIFSVNGHCAYVNPDNPEQVITDITIYGNTMFLEPSGSETPMKDWDGNPLSQKTVYDLAYDVYSYCPKGIVINDGEMASIDGEGVMYLYIGAENIIVRQKWGDDIQGYYKIYLSDSLSELNYLKMGAPYYFSIEENITHDTDQLADTSGWIIVNARSDSAVAEPIEVIIDGSTITKMSCETGHWQTVVIPVMEGMTWSVTVPNSGVDWIDWEIKFLPCTPLYMI